mmetsp:Transcript_34446/g.83320  ORF Transcript_34446/g.83320 Transcript_34446/m.83320 type:complete len:205 (+) Transcript_34446:139-753(+)|eukprot:CAMPEP_0114534802 /NCGR_PEP_ID=MMETSP0109-20121206/28044_1 /TAXON_ID=29199 /ORGANISM="Chlorarachnion reptans, Strain CCCM449" /LENGTH=204 /DNA_ID=CAMNT_0001718259 /DNA_START=94 /DNA_END=708 /DNA_ORIENTATION=+
MCLFPIDGYQQMLIPPSERARGMATQMRVVIFVHLVFILGFFLSALYVDGVVDLLGAMIGYMAIRNSRGYNFQQVLCYSIYLGMDCFWSIIRSVLFMAGLSRNQMPLRKWQYHVYVGTILGSGFFYFVGCFVTYRLYRELRSIFSRMMDEAPAMNNDRHQYQAVPSNNPDAEPIAINPPNNQQQQQNHSDNNFTPFSGKKYSLR